MRSIHHAHYSVIRARWLPSIDQWRERSGVIDMHMADQVTLYIYKREKRIEAGRVIRIREIKMRRKRMRAAGNGMEKRNPAARGDGRQTSLQTLPS